MVNFHFSLSKKIIVFSTLVLIIIIVPFFYIAKASLHQFGSYAYAVNEKQIKRMSEDYLLRIAAEQAKIYDGVFKRIKTTSALMGRHLTSIYNNFDAFSKTPLNKAPSFEKKMENGMFYTPPHEAVLSVYWGAPAMSDKIKAEFTALSHYEPMLMKSKELVNESLATHVITTSGIGIYYTMNLDAKNACYDLPQTSVFDLRDGEPVVMFTHKKTKVFDTQWTSIYKDDVVDDLMMTASTPIYNNRGEFKGITGIDIPVGYIVNDLIEGGFISEDSHESILFAFLQNKEGKIIAFPSEFFSLFGIHIDLKLFEHSNDIFDYSLNDSTINSVREIASRIKTMYNGTIDLLLDNKKYILSIGSLSSVEWKLVLVTKEEDIMMSVRKTGLAMEKSLRSIWKDFLAYSGLIIVFSIIPAVCAIWFFISPIKKFIEATDKVSKGDFSTKLKMDRDDEIGILSRSFNRMIEKLKKSEKIEKEYAKDLENRIKLRTIALEKSNEKLTQTKAQLEKMVEKRTIQLKKLNEHLVYTEEGERKAIASDLHDSVTQTLAMSISKIKNIQEADTEKNHENLLEVQGYLEQAVREIRSLIYQLSPPILDDFDIEIALGFLIEKTNAKYQSEFAYVNNVRETVKLKQPVKVTLYRAVNELMMNTLKHSGASKGKIDVLIKNDTMIVKVEDYGSGFDIDKIKNTESFGFGLSSLSERMKNFGGEMLIDSQRGRGTKVDLIVPILSDREREYEKS